jgi:uncharacterized protein (TIGR00251 family)
VKAATISVRVLPRARRDEVGAIQDGVLLIRVTAPASEGHANRALCRLVAKQVGVAPSRVRIVRGQASRHKLLAVEGFEQAALHEALEA